VVVTGIACIAIGIEMSLQQLFDAGGLLLLAHILTFQRVPLATLLQRRLIRTHRCPECALEMDLIASWWCPCRYTSPERHAFSACPSCGKGFAWIACPGCGTGFLI
jgi:hypothetical protein